MDIMIMLILLVNNNSFNWHKKWVHYNINSNKFQQIWVQDFLLILNCPKKSNKIDLQLQNSNNNKRMSEEFIKIIVW